MTKETSDDTEDKDNIHLLILDHLRAIRGDIAEMKGEIHDLKDGQTSIREQLHAIQGDGLRQERAIAALQLEVGRIKNRLSLVDA